MTEKKNRFWTTKRLEERCFKHFNKWNPEKKYEVEIYDDKSYGTGYDFFDPFKGRTITEFKHLNGEEIDLLVEDGGFAMRIVLDDGSELGVICTELMFGEISGKLDKKKSEQAIRDGELEELIIDN